MWIPSKSLRTKLEVNACLIKFLTMPWHLSSAIEVPGFCPCKVSRLIDIQWLYVWRSKQQWSLTACLRSFTGLSLGWETLSWRTSPNNEFELQSIREKLQALKTLISSRVGLKLHIGGTWEKSKPHHCSLALYVCSVFGHLQAASGHYPNPGCKRKKSVKIG